MPEGDLTPSSAEIDRGQQSEIAPPKQTSSQAIGSGKKLLPGQRPPNWVGPDGTAPKEMSANKKIVLFAVIGIYMAFMALILVVLPRLPSAPKAPVQTAASDASASPAPAAAKRVYAEGDFKWPRDAGPERAAVVRIANRIMEQRPECDRLDVENLKLVGRPSRGTFSLTCMASFGEIGVFEFRAADAASGRSFARIEPIGKIDAAEACKNAVLMRVTHPSTVEFPTFDYDLDDYGEGRTELRTTFTAKNGFGLELKHRVGCQFLGENIESVSIAETY